MTAKTITLSDELYEAIQEMKKIFSEMSGENIESDEQVVGILVSGFIESLNHEHSHEHGEDHECCGQHDGGEGCCNSH